MQRLIAPFSVLLVGGLLLACRGSAPATATATVPAAKYLAIWAGPQEHIQGDKVMTPIGPSFVAIIDADTASPGYGSIVTSVPIGDMAMMPHHMEYVFPRSGVVFADDYTAGKAFLIDLRDPTAPKRVRTMDGVPGFEKPHSFARLANNHVIATLQYGNGMKPGNPGGIAEFDADGKLVRSVSSADSSMPGARIRNYGLEVLPAIDRMVTTSAPMDTEHTANTVQLWRLSDLKLLKTIAMPKVANDSVDQQPFEVRALPDGKSVMLNSYLCGMYHLTVDGDTPRVELVNSLRSPPESGCSVPVIVGRYWVIPVAYGRRVVSLDISDPTHATQVAELKTDSTFLPHWLSADPGSDRIVLVGQDDGEPRVTIIRLDQATGALSWDDRFHDGDRTKHGVSFARTDWPHGKIEHVVPHGALFVAQPKP
jgi:hypothetical protein